MEKSPFTYSNKGYTTDELGIQWLQYYFEPQTHPANLDNYHLLLLDVHHSHYNLPFLMVVGIEMLCRKSEGS
jgi:hypothetical protein